MEDIEDIFLSFYTATTGTFAVELSGMLKEKKYSTFVCGNMAHGQDFRKTKSEKAAKCKIMIVFVDEQWARSKECISEFKCAYSRFNKKETPKIIPLVVGGFRWIDPGAFPEAHLITANFQCLQKGDSTTWEKLFDRVLRKVDGLMSEDICELALETFAQSTFLDMVKCEICQEPFGDPRLLPCTHTFCKQCLIEWKNSECEKILCPKCRIPCTEDIEDLKIDFRASKVLDFLGVRNGKKDSEFIDDPTGGDAIAWESYEESDEESNEKPGGPCEAKLIEWFNKTKMPEPIIDALIEQGFESLDIVLDMSESDIKELGLKLGHEKKLIKTINESKELGETSFAEAKPTIAHPPSPSQDELEISAVIKEEENIDSSIFDNWILVDELYDDRALSCGTIPSDTLKFWASMSRPLLEKLTDNIDTQADTILDMDNLDSSIKSKCLQQAAMVLCEAGSFVEAEVYARASLEHEKSSKRKYNVKIILIYVLHCKIMWDTKDRVEERKGLIELCDDVITNGARHISVEKLCKTQIIKTFSCHFLMAIFNRDFYAEEAHKAIEQALKLTQRGHEGLLAEANMAKANLVASINGVQDGKSLELLKTAWKLCDSTYGEFSILMSRIYANIAMDHELKRMKSTAYECYRRAWLIKRQLYGPHNSATKRSGWRLPNLYREIAAFEGDALPDDDMCALNEKDRNYKYRISKIF